MAAVAARVVVNLRSIVVSSISMRRRLRWNRRRPYARHLAAEASTAPYRRARKADRAAQKRKFRRQSKCLENNTPPQTALEQVTFL
jgi:hypothetical protein